MSWRDRLRGRGEKASESTAPPRAPLFGAEIRELRSPLTREMLTPLDPECQVVQFNSMLSEDELPRVAELLRSRPDVKLRAYGSYDGSITNLEFLRFFPEVRRFQVNVYELESLQGLAHLPDDADFLAVGQTRRRMDLEVLRRFGGLRQLFLEGHTKNFEVVSSFVHLVDLTLRSITLPDLEPLLPLRSLRAFDLKLGGTSNLALLPRVGELQYLELWMVKGLSDLTPVAQLESLRFLFLQALRRVEALPALEGLGQLTGVHIETMKGLYDVCALSGAPTLEELFLVDMGHLKPADLACLIGHPTLREATIGLGSIRKNEEANLALGLPRVSAGKGRWREAASDL